MINLLTLNYFTVYADIHKNIYTANRKHRCRKII